MGKAGEEGVGLLVSLFKTKYGNEWHSQWNTAPEGKTLSTLVTGVSLMTGREPGTQ